MCLLDNLSYNLGGSGLGQGIHKEHFFGAEGLAHALSHLIPQLTAQFLILIMSRSQNHKGDRPLTLDLMRNTHSGGLRDRRMLNESRFYLRRTCATPGYLDGVVRPPLEEPEAILVHVGPISMEPDIFPKAGEIRLNVPVRVIQETLGHGGSRTPAEQISQLAPHRFHCVIHAVHRHAQTGTAEGRGLEGGDGKGHEEAAHNLRPPRDVDDGNAASTHMLKEPPVRVRIPGFSSGSQILPPTEIKSLHVLQAFPHQSPDGCGGNTKMRNAQLLTTPPQTSAVRPVWRPLIYHHGGAEEVCEELGVT